MVDTLFGVGVDGVWKYVLFRSDRLVSVRPPWAGVPAVKTGSRGHVGFSVSTPSGVRTRVWVRREGPERRTSLGSGGHFPGPVVTGSDAGPSCLGPTWGGMVFRVPVQRVPVELTTCYWLYGLWTWGPRGFHHTHAV